MNCITSKINPSRFSAFLCLSFLAGALLASLPAHAQTCQLYPIALSDQTLTNAEPGTILNDIWNGTEPGNFGWLSWTGDPDEPTLINSLTPPGDSFTYINPDNANDHQVSIGDWVGGKPGVSNGKHVRAALDTIKGLEIIVPVWDQTRGQGENTAYHVVAFARIQLISYQLPSQNQIVALFLGYADCVGGNSSVPIKSRPHQTLVALASRKN